MENNKNYFTELNLVKCDIEKKNGLSYVSWADAWKKVKDIYPESEYIIYENEQWFPFWTSTFWIDCKVWVIINNIEHIIRLPVMDWANKAMKDTAYKYQTKYGEKTCEAATQFDINKTIMRAFAKAIAMHWIWLYVYRWEDFPEVELPIFTEDNLKKLEKVKDKFTKEQAIEEAKKWYQVSDDMLKRIEWLYN